MPRTSRFRRRFEPGSTSCTPTGSRAKTSSVEYDEIVGYHLEQAFRYRAELGPVDDDDALVGSSCGRAARNRGTPRVHAERRSGRREPDLAQRRAALHPTIRLRVELVPNVRVIQGLPDLSWADRVLTEAVEAAATSGNRALPLTRSSSAAFSVCSRAPRRLRRSSSTSPIARSQSSRRSATSSGSRGPGGSSPRRTTSTAAAPRRRRGIGAGARPCPSRAEIASRSARSSSGS